MTDKDNITLPREVAEKALEALMVATTPIPADRYKVIGSITALRAALAAEQPKQEPFVVRHYADDLRPTIKGNGFDGLEIGEDRQEAEKFVAWVNAQIATAEQPKPEPVAWMDRFGFVYRGKGPYKTFTTPLYTAPPATHPGYVIGSHWLETAYSRVCAGEAEADVLRDCGWERVDDIEALRRDAELGRWIREETPPIEEIAARVDAMEDER